jgi:hypothetical protein
MQAQHSGGNKDGYASGGYQNAINIFAGSTEDGYHKSSFSNEINIFAGGNKDGYKGLLYQNPISIFAGGVNDGVDHDDFSNPISIFSGGILDGHHKDDFYNNISIYSGGEKDGYDLAKLIEKYVWTGAVGTGWNVTDNWRNLQIPDINSKVIIPSGVPNFPFVNAGLMSIGQDVNGGDYLCNQLLIRTGAELTFRINTEVENYGNLNIKGTVFVLNPTSNTFRNLPGGKITLENGGRLEFNN